MKFIGLVLGITQLSAKKLSAWDGSVPKGVKAADWNKYRAERGEHDCEIKEANNWFGTGRCFAGWECQGARTCLSSNDKDGSYGWCNGDSACEQLGPLDYHDEEGETVWNHGVDQGRDLN